MLSRVPPSGLLLPIPPPTQMANGNRPPPLQRLMVSPRGQGYKPGPPPVSLLHVCSACPSHQQVFSGVSVPHLPFSSATSIVPPVRWAVACGTSSHLTYLTVGPCVFLLGCNVEEGAMWVQGARPPAGTAAVPAPLAHLIPHLMMGMPPAPAPPPAPPANQPFASSATPSGPQSNRPSAAAAVNGHHRAQQTSPTPAPGAGLKARLPVVTPPAPPPEHRNVRPAQQNGFHAPGAARQAAQGPPAAARCVHSSHLLTCQWSCACHRLHMPSLLSFSQWARVC